jgi:glycosyltransferase involved in cell wall biosynthesis
MKIWIVSLYDPTEIDNTRPMRFLSLAHKSVELGHDVTYFSNTFRHATKKNRFETQTIINHTNTYRTIFVKSSPYKKNLSIGRLYSHFLYANNIIKCFNNLNTKPDIIISALPPLLTNYKITKWSSKKNIPFVLDIIDPWPEVFTHFVPNYLKSLLKLLLLPFSYQLKVILKKSLGVVSISNQYINWSKKYIFTNDKKNAVFYPSIPFLEYQSIISKSNISKNNKLKIIYAGNLGLSYDLPCILNAAKILEERYPGKTEFIVAGSGHFESAVRKYQENYSNLIYLGRIGYNDLLEQYANSDLGLAQYPTGATQSITYKFFDYLGAGLPILNSLQSEMAELTTKYKVGLNNNPGDFNQLANNIEFFFNQNNLISYKENSLNLTKEQGDNNKVYKLYTVFLENLVSENK